MQSIFADACAFRFIVDSAFERPTEWIPERWTEWPEMVKDNRVHLPFALGTHASDSLRIVDFFPLRIVS